MNRWWKLEFASNSCILCANKQGSQEVHSMRCRTGGRFVEIGKRDVWTVEEACWGFDLRLRPRAIV